MKRKVQKPGSVFPQKTETQEEKIVKTYIEIRKSRLPGAGLGAFAAEDLPKDISLGPQRGLILSKSMYDILYPEDDGADQVVEMNLDGQTLWVDAISTEKGYSSWTRQINDPQNTNLRPNVVLEEDGFFRTLCTIPKGCEIQFSYGTTYWSETDVLEIQQLEYPECDCK